MQVDLGQRVTAPDDKGKSSSASTMKPENRHSWLETVFGCRQSATSGWAHRIGLNWQYSQVHGGLTGLMKLGTFAKDLRIQGLTTKEGWHNTCRCAPPGGCGGPSSRWRGCRTSCGSAGASSRARCSPGTCARAPATSTHGCSSRLRAGKCTRVRQVLIATRLALPGLPPSLKTFAPQLGGSGRLLPHLPQVETPGGSWSGWLLRLTCWNGN